MTTGRINQVSLLDKANQNSALSCKVALNHAKKGTEKTARFIIRRQLQNSSRQNQSLVFETKDAKMLPCERAGSHTKLLWFS
jgi:hypothetical protein